ncbi:xanthine dehydrogenase/oxidase-like [Anthonomus grandis grandis]|uniref:xanthine dehydrogenase/oxidase-like n=1 Tax=Anthonomus grandis grandis TaxID=2921223 RepID=UPI002165542D|nr:xanthine dehydrogenase/oxidase-like [Anthonomus grandis grandis]
MKELSSISFNISGTTYEVKAEDVTPQTDLNTYLRERAYLKGTKRMCMEGGCGSCIVAVEEVKPNGEKSVFAVNSCLVSILSCHGWKIHSIEGIGDPMKGLNAIQKSLAENNGTQCGFCSPGMVMNMFALQQSGQQTKYDIENSFAGNICRCTGYRPILTAFYNFATTKNVADIEDIGSTLTTCSKINKKYEKPTENFTVKLGKSSWIKVYYLKDLMEIIGTSGDKKYMLVAGNTAQGVNWPTRILFPEIYIDITSLDHLIDHTITDTSLILGANISLSKTMDIFNEAAKKYASFSYLMEAANHIDLIANVPVRNIGTLAGNLMLKHQNPRFQSDIFVILETIKATIIIIDVEENEFRKSPQEFLGIDMNKKVIKEIMLKSYDARKYFYKSYKVMPRAQNAHAIVNAGFLIKLSKENVVKSASIVYGGINAEFAHASATETLLNGLNLFDNQTLQKAFQSLDQEVKPDQDPLEPSPECRKKLAINLFYKFVLNIAPSSLVTPKHQSGGTILSRPVSNGVQEFTPDKKTFPMGEPIIKLEAIAQASGQAQYIIDKPDLPNQLHASFVTADAPSGSEITLIDPSNVIALDGVVAFYTAKDIPGANSITVLSFGLGPEELLCSGTVQYYNQPIGIVVANSHNTAMEAAKLVKVEFKRPATKPLLTPMELLAANKKDRIKHETSVVPKKTGKATKTVKGDFYMDGQYHYHMETQCSYAIPTEEGLEIWPSTQWIAHTQFAISQILNLDAQKIDVSVKRLGGSYGGKIIRGNYANAAAALAAYKLQKPVRMWMPFHTNMDIIGKRHPFYMKYEVGVNDKGAIQNMTAELYSDSGNGPGNEKLDYMIIDCFESCYNVDSWGFDTFTARTDNTPNCYTRAPGTLEGLAGIESIMDHIAYTLNMDPLDVRIANLDTKKYSKVSQFINEMKTKDNLMQRIEDVKKYNAANRWKKKGIGLAAMKWRFSLLGSYTTLVSIYFQNGGVAISHGGIEIGQGINTKAAQVCAYKLGIPVSMVSIKPSNNLVAPNSFATGGSFASESICYSVMLACDKLLRRMDPVKKANPKATWDQLVKMCHVANINLSANGYVFNDGKGIQDYDIFGLCTTEVEVDILTGQKVISRVDIIEDVGQSLSPLIDIGQIEGAFVMGLGHYLTEELKYNDEGKLLNNRTWNYKPPGMKDIPVDFRIRIPPNNPNPIGALKSKATGEPPMCLSVSAPLAVRNAIASARTDADSTKPRWVPFNGPTTVEHTILNSLTDYSQFTI